MKSLLSIAFTAILVGSMSFGAFASDRLITVADNGNIYRSVKCTDEHIISDKYLISGDDENFLESGSCEFSFLADGKQYSGLSKWKNIEVKTRKEGEASVVILSTRSDDDKISVEISYTSYPGLPLVRKDMRIINSGKTDIKIEGVQIEDFEITFDIVHSETLRSYARYQALGPYVGNWDDPLVVIHAIRAIRGMAIGNETIGILKRTSVFEEGKFVKVGTTMPEQDYPFRRWLAPGQSWKSAAVFTAPYSEERDPQRIVNTVVQKYVRKYMGLRLEQIEHKPMFVYNTWVPFYNDINETLVKEVAKAAAECGVEEFIVDDGWQTNNGSGNGTASGAASAEDWAVNTEKFPHGMKPVFDYIKSLGMKPGIWLSVGRLDKNNKTVLQCPQWVVRDVQGNMTDLHTGSSDNVTLCMGTEWCNYIKNIILHNVQAYGIEYLKLDLSIIASAYVYDPAHTGCYATDHKYHRDHAESYDVIYEKCMQMIDELHAEVPKLFIDFTFETAGRLQLMDYGIARHADGNWLCNVGEPAPQGPMRIRHLAWVRTPVLPATSLVMGNQSMDDPMHLLAYKSLAGTLPIMLGDPRRLSPEERAEFKSWANWLKSLENRHGIMSFREDLPGFGEPVVGGWDGFCRINTDSRSGGLVGVFREGAAEKERTVTVRDLDADATYIVRQGPDSKEIAKMTGKELQEKGFRVSLDEEYSGELFEISKY